MADGRESAIGYAVNVLAYMQNGGRLADVEATAAEILRLHARELDLSVPGAVKAAVLRDSVEEMKLRHNSLEADEVFRDMQEQARIAGLNGK